MARRSSEAPLIVAGIGPLGLAIVRRLASAGARVHAVADPRQAAQHAHELRRLGVPCTTGSPFSVASLRAAGLEKAAVLVLADNDDDENGDAALSVRRAYRNLPIVVRIFDPALRGYLEARLTRVTILSVQDVAAPVFADAVDRAIASRGSARPEASPPAPKRRFRVRLDRVLLRALVGFLFLIVPASFFFQHELHLRWIDALYFVWTTVLTVGYGDLSLLHASDATKIAGMALMFGGACALAILFALITDRVIAARLDALRGRVPVRGRGHVVIVGAGDVGYRSARILAQRGRRIVVVERDAEGRNVQLLREDGHHVVISDAASEDSLDLAAANSAAAVLAVTDSDAVNLHVALTARQRGRGVPVVMRVVSSELSEYVTERGDAVALSPVAVASEAFTRATLAAAGNLARFER